MRARTTRRPGRNTENSDASYSEQLLAKMFQILVSTGHSPTMLLRQARSICKELKQPAYTWNPEDLIYLSDLPHVIAHWHADPQYLDSAGAPLALPLKADGPSLAALIERVLPEKDPVAVLRSLKRLKGVKRRGSRYVPSSRQFVYPKWAARVHGLTALSGLLGTVQRNVSGKHREPLVERVAINPAFPARALNGFHRQLETQISKFLWDQDGAMRELEADDRDGDRVRLGVGVFVFQDPISRKPASRSAPRRRPRIRGGGQ